VTVSDYGQLVSFASRLPHARAWAARGTHLRCLPFLARAGQSGPDALRAATASKLLGVGVELLQLFSATFDMAPHGTTRRDGVSFFQCIQDFLVFGG
jgi:hypothetical protein